MKFIKEKFDANYLRRRIRDEDAKSDRKVTEVLLTPQEWFEFVRDMGFAPWESYYRVAMYDAAPVYSLSCNDSAVTCDGPRVVTIRRG